MKFYKIHKTSVRFWDYETKTWLKKLPSRNVIIINFRGENVHPCFWKDNWFNNEGSIKNENN